MAAWQPAQYLLFEKERTRPCRDLVAQIDLPAPRKIVDLGCGPGNSTAVLAEHWPAAKITGVDNSAEMLARARKTLPQCEWLHQDIIEGVEASTVLYDLVFANAALQWVPNHAALYPKLMARVAPGGALAVQVPFNMNEAAHQLMRDVAASSTWRSSFPAEGVREWFVHEPGFYYDVLSPLAENVNIWETVYIQVMPSVEAITEWYRGTGLRPFLDSLRTEEERKAFTDDYTEALRTAYRPQVDGRVLFPFRRLFLIAKR